MFRSASKREDIVWHHDAFCCGAGGNLVSDAHLAALAIEQGAELGTFDRDFSRFAGLRVALLK